MLYDTQIFYTTLEWLAGSAIIIDFMINTIKTLFTAMGYAELGSATPEAGGAFFGLEKDCQSQMLFISS